MAQGDQREETPPLRSIVGLGNPDPRYTTTRHNAGARLLEELRRQAGGAPLREDGRAWAGLLRPREREIWLVRPRTYMNSCGPAVAHWLASKGLDPATMLVLCDDLDLPLGRIRIRPRGGTGGHLGLQSLVDALGTGEFPRLRLGIGRPPAGTDPAEYVLDLWTAAEETLWDRLLPWAAEAVWTAVRAGLPAAMSTYNGAPGPPGWNELEQEGGNG